MKAKVTLKDVALFASIIPEGIDLWTDSPRCDKIKLIQTKKQGNVLVIQLQRWNNDNKCWDDCKIAIDQRERESQIIEGSSDLWLLHKPYLGTAGLGLFIVSLPVTLPLSPILLGINIGYKILEKRRGLSRHSYALLKSLKGQLEPRIEELLTIALKNLWKSDEESRKR